MSRPSGFSKRLTALGAIAIITNVAVLSSWVIGNQSASGFPIRSRDEPTEQQFEACTETLLELGLEIPIAVDTCGAAAAPEAFSNCIADISNDTLIPVTDALAGCVRVRRPEQMASCVVALDENFAGTLSSEILGYCSRSLLPAVFENCVQGVTGEAVTDAMLIMDSCVEADYDAPQVFLPTFQPRRSAQ
ncbi:MAG: hypothetical protein F6K30_25700 [Cyanothece sp. SIO2G6]|nr:hypothetical protein [Cyanothece sp. SIO2G6]